MRSRLVTPAVLLASHLCAQPNVVKQPFQFMGRDVTITEPELDEDRLFPKGPATICVEAPPQRQCYTAPNGYGLSPTVSAVQIAKNTPALFFAAASGGVSGFSFHFAVLCPGLDKDLENFFFSDMSLSNQSEHAFWDDPTISEAPIFVTADWVSSPNEGHYGPHRYKVSAFVLRASSQVDDLYYYVEDLYMTAHTYDLEDDNVNILNSEKQEILARLKRVRAEREKQAPR